MTVNELCTQVQALIDSGLGECEIVVSADIFPGSNQLRTLAIKPTPRVLRNFTPPRVLIDAYTDKRPDALILPPTPPRSNVP